jgi:hypothetical protein
MTSPLGKHVAMALATVALLMGCASRGAQPVEAVVVHPIPKKIALVSVVRPPTLTVENRGGALSMFAAVGHLVQRNLEKERAVNLTTMMREQSLSLDDEMTAALNEELVKLGYAVEVIRNAKRPKDDPEGVEYESIETDADAIVTARYFGAGLYAGQFSTDYVPRLNVDIEVVSKRDHAELHSQSIYYGVDARKSTEDQIPADARYAYASFDQVFAKRSEVAESFRVGVRQIAALAARQLQRVGRQ